MRCDSCGAGEDRQAQRWLEAHEDWTYDEARRVRTLRRLICLCTGRHTVTHFGYAQVRGPEAQAFAPLVRVTGMSLGQASQHVDAAFELWDQRSALTWSLDVSILTAVGITVTPPPDARDRRGVAAATLAGEAQAEGPPATPNAPSVPRQEVPFPFV